MKATIVFEKNWEALNSNKFKYIINKGSSRSSKTHSILQIFWLLASTKANTKLAVFRNTKKDCKDTVLGDMLKYYPTLPNWNTVVYNKTESIFSFPNGSTINIEGTDDELKVHGYHSDYLWFNEFYRMPVETFHQLDMRCTTAVFMDYNPIGQLWSDNLLKADNSFVIHSTFKDNPFCPEEQKKKILSYEDTEYNREQGTADPYKWQVYGLGLKAERPERVFRWKEIPDSQYLLMQEKEYYGVDWGAVDPFGILEAKYYDGKLFLHERNYTSENEWRTKLNASELTQIAGKDEGFVSWLFTRLNIKKNRVVVCDNNRPTKIMALRSSGWDYACAVQKRPGDINDGVDLLKSLDVYYTASSVNIAFEQENYSHKKDRMGIITDEYDDLDNHLIDPARYVALYLQREGIIRKV